MVNGTKGTRKIGFGAFILFKDKLRLVESGFVSSSRNRSLIIHSVLNRIVVCFDLLPATHHPKNELIQVDSIQQSGNTGESVFSTGGKKDETPARLEAAVNCFQKTHWVYNMFDHKI